jgi:hypothetical protein
VNGIHLRFSFEGEAISNWTKWGDNQTGFQRTSSLIARKIIIGIVTVLAALYGGDDLVLRYKLAHHELIFGSLPVDHYQVVPLKGGKQEFDYTGSEQVACVYALFPHAGDQPCWYLQRHREKRQNL